MTLTWAPIFGQEFKKQETCTKFDKCTISDQNVTAKQKKCSTD